MKDKRIILNSAALAGVLHEIEHNCSMLVLGDDETAGDDVEFYVPRILAAADELRRLINTAEPVKPPETSI